MSLLELDNVQKRWGSIEALRGVTFSVNAGEVVGLVGDNGAGKSTLMKTVTGVHQPSGGTIRFDGNLLNGKEPGAIRSLGIEMIYQDLALARMQDVATNIFLGREPMRRFLGTPIRMIDRARTEREAEVMIKKLGARVPSVKQIVGKLSGGQQQSVAIARALTFNPKLVIMDEPTAALAVREVEHVLELIRGAPASRYRGHPDQSPAERRVRGLRPGGGAPSGAGHRQRGYPGNQHERGGRAYRRGGIDVVRGAGGVTRRIAIIGVSVEALITSPIPTDIAAMQIHRGDEILRNDLWLVRGALDRLAVAPGYAAVPLIWATALPGGALTPDCYAAIKTETLERLAAEGPFEGSSSRTMRPGGRRARSRRRHRLHRGGARGSRAGRADRGGARPSRRSYRRYGCGGDRDQRPPDGAASRRSRDRLPCRRPARPSDRGGDLAGHRQPSSSRS